MGKKIILLLILLILLIIFTVTTFDYKTIINDYSSNQENSNWNKNELVSTVLDKYEEIKKEIFGDDVKIPGEVVTIDPIHIELLKVDGNVILNGILKNEEQANIVSALLNVNRDGEIKYNPTVKMDKELLQKLSQIIPTFKDFLSDGSKLIVDGENVSLSGDLKDPSYKELLISIVDRIGLNIDLNIANLDVKTKTEEIIETIKEKNITNLKDVATDDEVKKITEKVEENSVEINDERNSKQVQSEINNVLASNKITFERRSTKITEDSFDSVKKVAAILNDNLNLKIEIGGHTDSRGAASLNKRISQDRANSVMQALIDLGVDKSRLSAVGYGEDFPIAQDDADGLSEINRRVEIKILGDK